MKTDLVLVGLVLILAVIFALQYVLNPRNRDDKGTVSRRWLNDDKRRQL